MAYPKYCQTSFRAIASAKDERWPYVLSKFLHPNYELEQEIDMLRRKMEKLVDEENSFTSEAVVAISTLLDKKIYEYMKSQSKSR